MSSIGIRELRGDLAAAVRRAGNGERVIVTVGGRPIAQLGPIEAVADQPTLDDLVARGLVTAPSRPDRPQPTIALPMWAGTRLDQLLREVRGR
jgi:prevent-host-death family protein